MPPRSPYFDPCSLGPVLERLVRVDYVTWFCFLYKSLFWFCNIRFLVYYSLCVLLAVTVSDYEWLIVLTVADDGQRHAVLVECILRRRSLPARRRK